MRRVLPSSRAARVEQGYTGLAKADNEQIKSKLLEINWQELRDISTIEGFPILFTSTLLQICQIFTPVKKVKFGKSKALTALQQKKGRLQARLLNQ